jgi:hypothetical protein
MLNIWKAIAQNEDFFPTPLTQVIHNYPLTFCTICICSFNHWELYITWHSLNFPISPAACFIVYCVTWLVCRGTVPYLPLLITQTAPFPELSLTLEVRDYNYACICLKGLSLINLSLFLVTMVMTFPLAKHHWCKNLKSKISYYHNHKCYNFKCHVKTCLNTVPLSLE